MFPRWQMVADLCLDNQALNELVKTRVASPEHRRAAVELLQSQFAITQRHACLLVGQPRATHRYGCRRAAVPGLRERLISLAKERRRIGYPRLCMLPRREGSQVNHKRVYWLYREGGLKLHTKRSKDRIAGSTSPPLSDRAQAP